MTLKVVRNRTPQALLFDLDGTLLDSAPDLAQAIDGMLQALDFPQAGEARVRTWVGEGSRMLVRQALMFARGTAPADTDIDAAQQIFFKHYGAFLADRSRLFAGVSEALDHWQQAGLAMACVTNKPARFTEPLLDHFGLRHYLPVAISGDTLPVRKPDPAPLLEACRRLGVGEAHAVMIGDSRNDVLAARAAGIPVVCVTYGYNHGRPIAGEGADRLVDAFGELVGSVAAL